MASIYVAAVSHKQDWAVNDIVDQIVEQHGSVLEGVSSEQVHSRTHRLPQVCNLADGGAYS
jgi:hypothetical protein